MSDEFPRYLLPAEAAALLRVSEATIYEMVKRGDLPAFTPKHTRIVRIPANALGT